jgi:hypothetical protein
LTTETAALPFDGQTAPQARSLVSELAQKNPAGNPDVPPYFWWPTRWPVSTAGLWGSYLKSLLSFKEKERASK